MFKGKKRRREKPEPQEAAAVADELEALISESMELWEDGELEEALRAAELACELDPASSAAHHCRAAALLDQGRFEEALAACDAGLAAAPDDPEALLYAADFYIHNLGDEIEAVERGIELARRGGKRARAAGDRALEGELLLVEGEGEEQRGRLPEALACVERALELLGPDAAAELERGILLLELCRFDAAREQLERLVRDGDRAIAADACHHLGLIDERRGDKRAAAKRFGRARKLCPDDFPEPCRLSPAEFDRAVEDALARLPEKLRAYLANVAITVEEIPGDDDLTASDPPLSPLVLGMFRGSPLGDKAGADPWAHFPSSIVLYQNNLERFARGREELIEQIGVTLMHEVGHFLGLDEDGLRQRGLA